MKVKEANDFIKSQIAAGVTTGEIIETLMLEKTIGSAKPYREKIIDMVQAALSAYDDADDTDADVDEPAAIDPVKRSADPEPQGGVRVYEKWKVEARQVGNKIMPGEKMSKIKDVLIDEETANRLNDAKYLCGRGYIIQYF